MTIALDTSALLRYLTNDVPPLAKAVADVIEGPDGATLSSLVLLEAAYALRSRHYGWDNPQVADALIDLLAHDGIVLSDMPGDLASAAIAGVRHVSARHIADALVAAAARHGGAEALLTGDAKFASELIPLVRLQADHRGSAGEPGATAP